MNDRQKGSAERRFGLALWALGAIGCASLLLAPLELMQPPPLDFAPLAFRALSLINPLILLTALVALGTWLAPCTSLDAPLVRAWLKRAPLGQIFQRQFLPALGVGILGAMILLLFAAISAPWFAETIAARFDMPLLPRLLYGGITEELISRWGLMTLSVWLLMRLRLRARRPISAARSLPPRSSQQGICRCWRCWLKPLHRL